MYDSTVSILKWLIAECNVIWLYLKDGMLDVAVNNVDFVSLDGCVPEAVHMGLQSTLWHGGRGGRGTHHHTKGCGMMLSSTAKSTCMLTWNLLVPMIGLIYRSFRRGLPLDMFSTRDACSMTPYIVHKVAITPPSTPSNSSIYIKVYACMCMCVLHTSISLFSASRVLNAFCTSLIIWKACPKLLIALEGPAAVERRELQEHMQQAQDTIIPSWLVHQSSKTTANFIATRADYVFDSSWWTAYISFTKAISGLGKYVSSVRAMALQSRYTGSVSDNIHSHCMQWSMTGSGCTYVHAGTEKIHSEIHIISFFTTADVLGKPSWRNN